jgi:hypothetical protein
MERKRMKKFALTIGVVIMSLALVGCNPGTYDDQDLVNQGTSSYQVNAASFQTEDGRTVHCIVTRRAMSCDWATAR